MQTAHQLPLRWAVLTFAEPALKQLSMLLDTGEVGCSQPCGHPDTAVMRLHPPVLSSNSSSVYSTGHLGLDKSTSMVHVVCRRTGSTDLRCDTRRYRLSACSRHPAHALLAAATDLECRAAGYILQACPRRCVARAYCEDRSAHEQACGCWLGPSWEQHRCSWPSSGNDKPCHCCLPPDTCEGPTRSSCSGSGGGPCLRSMCRTTSSARLHRRQYCSAPNCRTFVSRQHLQQHPLHQQDNSTCLHMCLRSVFALWESYWQQLSSPRM